MSRPKSAHQRPQVSIKKSVYAMATTDSAGDSAEITMYGDIYEEQPTNWWGEPIEGQYILLSEFLEDLKQISSCKNITIRMNSYGGDAGASNMIHNRLRELARSGAKLTCIVDGVAMSGGSIIMCACDTVKVNPSSIIMIHKCWQFCGAVTMPTSCGNRPHSRTHGTRCRQRSISGKLGFRTRLSCT